MGKKNEQRQKIVSESNGNGQVGVERAISDGVWRNRPLWRFMRPDHHYGPKLTLAARQLLKAEANHVADDHR